MVNNWDFKFIATTIDGQILEFPQEFYLRCDLVKPLGPTIVRQFNNEECIVARKVFLVYYQGQNLGSPDYKTMDDFIKSLNAACVKKEECKILHNGCVLEYNNCPIKY
jgi:hypothetical protein